VTPVGRWLANPVLELLPDSRLVRFPEDVEYRSANGEHHVIPQGTISDGLTAPAWTWSVIGSPLTPRYRRPAGLHDVHVTTHNVTKAQSIALLYETLREGGTGRLRARLFVTLVRWFGPKW
jgi:hypothetical protein